MSQINPERLILRPSNAPRWVHCTGSVFMEAHYPDDEDSVDAKEGTAAHWVVSETLYSYSPQSDSVRVCSDFLNSTAPNGVIIDPKMVEAAEVMVRDVLATTQESGTLDKLHVESPIKIHNVHANNEGTPDVWVYDGKASILTIWDFKYGWGVVEAFENWQLLDYLMGVLEEIGTVPSHVVLKIVQPRAYHPQGSVRSWAVRPEDGAQYFTKLVQSANKACSTNSTLVAGPHCSNCKASHDCPSLTNSVQQVLQIMEKTVVGDITNEGIAQKLDILQYASKLIKSMKTGVEAQAEAEITSGRKIPGWGMQAGRGSRKWFGDEVQILALGELGGVDLRVKDLLSPYAAEQKGLDPNLVKAYVKSIPGKLTLQKQSTEQADQIFNREGK